MSHHLQIQNLISLSETYLSDVNLDSSNINIITNFKNILISLQLAEQEINFKPNPFASNNKKLESYLIKISEDLNNEYPDLLYSNNLDSQIKQKMLRWTSELNRIKNLIISIVYNYNRDPIKFKITKIINLIYKTIEGGFYDKSLNNPKLLSNKHLIDVTDKLLYLSSKNMGRYNIAKLSVKTQTTLNRFINIYEFIVTPETTAQQNLSKKYFDNLYKDFLFNINLVTSKKHFNQGKVLKLINNFRTKLESLSNSYYSNI